MNPEFWRIMTPQPIGPLFPEGQFSMKRLILALFFCLLGTCTPHGIAQTLLTPVPNRVIGPIDETELVTLKGNVHPLARAQFDRGAAPGSMPTGRIRIVLERSAAQQRALTELLTDLQNPASPAYHKWLTPAQFGAEYGISESDILRVRSWLQSHGFKIEKVPESHQFIEFSGTFDQIQSAFHTAIHTFVVNGESHFANAGDPQIPAVLAPVIAGVGPLNDFRAKSMLVRGPEGRFDPSSGRIVPELTLTSNNFPYLFVDPADAAVIYDTPNSTLNPAYSGTTYDGTGVSIGIVGVSDLTTADVANYRMAFLGEASGSVNLPTVVVDGNDPGLNGSGVEALLDTEVSGGIAPKAKIYFYTSADSDISSGLFNAIFRAIDDNTVSILSISFGDCEAALGTADNQVVLEVAEQAAAQGITVTVSAGDNGSAGCDDFDTETEATRGFGVNGFASTPYSIAVGGTDFDTLSTSFATYVTSSTGGSPPYYGTALKYIPENPWNDSTSTNTTYANNEPHKNSKGETNIVAGSGGVSSVYAKPAFQSSLTPSDGARDLPDVSLLAGNGLYYAAWVICSDNVTDGNTEQVYTDCLTTGGQFTSNTVFGGVGGTSASAPAFAGMLALVAQAHGSAADNYRLGQADNVLYQLAQSKYSTVFHDVTTGDNSVVCASGSPDCGSYLFLTGYNAGTRYDLASGLGSVDAAAMVNNWTGVSLASTSTSLKINGSTAAYTGVHGQSLKFDVSVSPSAASGVAGIVDNADETNGGNQNNGQLPIPLSGGAGSAVYNGLPGGSYTVWARYGGDTANASSTSTPPISVSITPEASTTTLAVNAYDGVTGYPISATNIPYGSYVIADAQITGTAEGSNTQGVATGTVTFNDGASTLGSASVTSGDQASWPALTANITILSGGSHQVTASYSGDPSFNPSSSQSVAFTIVPAATSLTTDSSNYSLASGQSTTVFFELNTNWNPGTGPTGTVSLIENNQVIASTSSFLLSQGINGTSLFEYVTGSIDVQSNQLQTGLNTITVAYSGDSNYAPATTTIEIENIAAGGGVTITTPSIVTLGSDGIVTATLTLTPSGGYSGLFGMRCSTTSYLISCSIPLTHVPVSYPVDTLVVLSGNEAGGPGTFAANISGSDNTPDGISLTATFGFTIPGAASPSLAVMNNGPLNVPPGASTANTSYVSIIPSGGLTGQVNLSCTVTTALSNPQSLPTCKVPSPVNLNGTNPVAAQVQANTTSATTAGTYAVVVTATSASTSSVTTTDSIPLTVTASPSFSVTGSGISSVAVGSNSTATFTITALNGFSGQVDLMCVLESTILEAGTLGSCNAPSSVMVSSGSPATVNVQILGNTQSGTGLSLLTLSAWDPNSTDLGIDASTDVLFTGSPAFTLSNSNGIQVAAGATAGNTSTISLTPEDGFTGTVNLTCAVTTSMMNVNDMPGCSLSPASPNISNAAAVTSTLTITTTAATSGAVVPVPGFLRFGSLTTVLAVVFCFGIPSKRRRWLRIVGAIVLAISIGAMGCGGGGSGGGGGGGGGGGNLGTTAGTYSVTVTGTDAATGKITSGTTLVLTVN